MLDSIAMPRSRGTSLPYEWMGYVYKYTLLKVFTSKLTQ